MIYLHKLLPLLVSPIVLVLSCILYGVFRNKRAFIFTGLSLLYLASTPLVSDRLFLLVENPAPPRDVDALSRADAIVVLGGMLFTAVTNQGIVAEWSDLDRFFGGLRLYKAGKSSRLIFTSGQFPWQNNRMIEGALLKQFAETQGIPEADIWTTEPVQNTEQESLAIKKLLIQENPSILLVTSAFHMPRAKQLFEKAGFTVQTYPVDYRVQSSQLTPMDFLPGSRALDLTSLAVRELLGRMYYQIKLNGLPSATHLK